MDKNKTRLYIKSIIIIALLLISLHLFLYFIIHTRSGEKKIKVGVIVPLTGPAAQHVVISRALNLVVDELNSIGGINGRKIELIIYDSKSDPQEGKKAFLEIERLHKPLLYISSTSAVSNAIAPLAEARQVVLMGLAVVDPLFTVNKKWIFKYFVSVDQEITPILTVLEKLKINKPGILYQDDIFGITHYNVLKKSLKKVEKDVVGVTFNASKPDFISLLKKLDNIEAIYIAGFVNVVGEALKELHDRKYSGVILLHSGATSLNWTMLELNNVYVAAPLVYDSNHIFVKAIKERYENKYDEVFTHQAANAYDFIKVLAGLLDNQEISRNNVRKLLESEFFFPGIFGYIEKAEGEHDIDYPLYPARIVNGKIQYLH